MQKLLAKLELPDSLSPLQKGAVYMLISVLGFALLNLTVKFLPHIPATELVLFRSAVSLILSLIMIRQKNIRTFGNNKKWLILRGVFGVIALTLFFYTLQKMPIASAITIQYLSPIFTMIIAVLLAGEHMRRIQWLFFLMSFVGVGIIKGFDNSVSTYLLILGIISAVFTGLAYNAIRKLKDSEDPVVIVFYFPLIATPVMFIVSLFYWVMPQGIDWVLLIFMGVLTQIAQINMTKALQVAPISKMAPLNYTGIIFAILFDMFIFDVQFQWITLVGIALVILGVILNMLQKSTPT